MDLLKDSGKRVTSVQWPEAVDARLDTLIALAARAGEQVSRSQMLAALVADASMDDGELGEKVRLYRSQLLTEFITETSRAGDLPTLHRPGRKRRAQQAGAPA